MKREAPIGVMDSGVGGLSVLKTLRKLLPEEKFIYLGDTARTPYGTRSEQQVRLFVEEMLSWFERQGVKMVVIACNTITVLGVDTLQKQHAFLLTGMSKGEMLAMNSKNKKIGVLATPFTVSTGAHKKAIEKCLPGARVYYQACPEFVPLIESEAFASRELQLAVQKYTKPMQEAGVDTLLLSCTHYPFIKEEIENAMGEQVFVADPAESTAAAVKQRLEEEDLLNSGSGGSIICCTADEERVKRLAGRMLGNDKCEFKVIDMTK